MTIDNATDVSRGAKADHVNGINSVRALAALSVVLAHIVGPELPNILKLVNLGDTAVSDLSQYIFTGHPAVIAFFVVSGFCIHYPYVCKPLPILPFWVARWIRIMIPALVAMALAKLARLHDYNFWDGYILWSIVCELFYYTAYPLFLWGSRWVTWRTQFYLALLLSIVVVTLLGSNQYGSAHIYGPLLNWIVALPSWLTGCVLAELIHKQDRPLDSCSRKVVCWRLVVAATASALYWATMNTGLGYYLTMNGFALFVFFWIRAEIASPHSSPLEWLGQWSYSIYLLHMPLFLIIVRLLQVSNSLKLLCLPLIFLLAYWLYRRIERPAHDYARKMFRCVHPRGLYVKRTSFSV